MNKAGKNKGGSYKTGHKIHIIDYSENTLECVCGWIGFAYDRPKYSEDFIESKDWPTHKKMATPIDSDLQEVAA